MAEMLDALTCIAVGCVLLPLGVWGRANVESLVASAILEEEREHRVAVLRRGALTCQVLAAVFALLGLALLVSG